MQWKLLSKLLIVLSITLGAAVVFFRRNFIFGIADDYDEFGDNSFCLTSQQQLLHKSGIDNVNNLPSSSLPISLPLDATYETSFSIPWIGEYTVRMVVISDRQATLIVLGDYDLQDVFQYQLLPVETACKSSKEDMMKPQDNHAKDIGFSVELSDYLKAILKQFTVSLATIRYNPRDEIVSVMVSMLQVITFPVKLKRRTN
jgi:hypothetical protein